MRWRQGDKVEAAAIIQSGRDTREPENKRGLKRH
jgi:hypothetical protein